MSIVTETREQTASIEQPQEVKRHTHDGINSVKINLTDVNKKLLPKAGGNDYLFNGEAVFNGSATGYAGSAPQILFNDGVIDQPSVGRVNAWVNATQSLLIDLIKRQETHSRVFVSNRFASFQQNPSSDAYDPLFTYFDRL